jgi:hypothetical protein
MECYLVQCQMYTGAIAEYNVIHLLNQFHYVTHRPNLELRSDAADYGHLSWFQENWSVKLKKKK